MRIQEIISESTQLDEGPILNKIGSGIGKAVGGLAKGVGAVAGGIAGIGSAVKKGYQAGKSTVGGAGDDPGAATPPAAGTSGAATPPASGAATSPAGSTGAATPPNAGGAGAATPPASGAATSPAGSTGAATPPAAGAATPPAGGAGAAKADPAGGAGAAKADPAAEASVKAIQQQVDKLSPDAKQKLLTKLQTSIEQGSQSAKENPTAQPAATSAPGAATPDATTPAATDATATTQPTAATPDATATTQPTVGKTSAPANKAAADTFEKAKGDIRKVQSGTKPLPDQMAQGVQADIAKMAKGDKESGVAAAQKIMGFAGKGMDVAALQQAWSANAKAGERFLSQSVYRSITNMLGEYGLAWKDLGISVRLVESVSEGVFIKYINRDLSETLSTKISEHKRRIFETQLSQGTASVFVK